MPSELQVTGLRCEYRTNPLGIDVQQPRLNWTLTAPGRGQGQSAYQILVASTPERLAAEDGDLWDSGRIESDATNHIRYSGTAVTSGQSCWWQVRAWDRAGIPTAWSTAACWELGLLTADDWTAAWIGVDAPLDQRPLATAQTPQAEHTLYGLQPSPYLRKEITLPQAVQQARLYVTAKGLYTCYLNGQRVGTAMLTPGWTNYDRRIQYQTYDVTALLHDGSNVLGAILGTGWYSGYVGFNGQCRHYGARPQLLLQLAVHYVDGSTATFASDGTWRAGHSPIIFSDLLMGESVDARAEQPGWKRPQFDDHAWRAVAVEPCDAAVLVADCAEPVQITEERRPTTITARPNNTSIVDMGQNMVGWVRLRVQGRPGTQIQLRFAEVLDEAGNLYTDSLRSARQTDHYIIGSDQPEVWEPHFTFHGFRYVEVTGYPGELTAESLTGCVVHSATPPTGTFTCSDPLVNQLQQNIVWGQRGNFLSIPTDCPQRDERLGWLGDAQIFVRTATFNMDVAAFFTKWMRDVVDAQSAAGAFPDVAPRIGHLADGAPAWGDAGVIVPWTIYRCYGDITIIAEHWAAMERWMDYLHQANPGLLRIARLNSNFGDWLSIKATTSADVLATAYWAYDAQLMADMAVALGKQDAAARYTALAEGIKAAFTTAFVAADGQIKGHTQTAYVLALHMQLLPDDQRAAALAHLVADIEQRGWHLSTGFVGVGYLLPVLTAGGRLDVAYRLLLNDTFPSWGYSIRQGATTIWERWDGWTAEHGFQDVGMNSFNHYSLGSVGEWLYRSVAGIDTAAAQPGYRHLELHPQPGGGLTMAEATYNSQQGPIHSRWQLDQTSFMFEITIPPNTTATLSLPTNDAATIKEGTGLATAATGVTTIGEKDGRAIFHIESGSYQFHSSYGA